jgi:hypothetical protein
MPRNDETKLQHCKKRIKNWEASGITQRAYCERERLKYDTFNYWRRQIRSTRGVANSRSTASVTNRLTLLPVHLSGQKSSESMRLHSPSGWQLELPGAVDTAWLATLLHALP